MKDVPFFSIIMPVYNVQKYLKRSIDSILNQTFTDFELILVDDCSIDNSSLIIADYAKRDRRIIVTKTKQNMGVANARNEGIKHVQGQYLTFVDSDDYIEPELFMRVKEVIEHTGAQLVKYSVVEQYYDQIGQSLGNKNVVLADQIYTTPEQVRKMILPMEKLPLFGYLCNSFYDLKTVPKQLWNFDTQWRINEDFRMNLELIDYISIMACMSYIGYHYEKRDNASLSTIQNADYYEQTKIKPKLLFQKYKQWGLLTPDYCKEIYWLYIRVVFSTISRQLQSEGWRSARAELNHIYHDALFKQFEIDNRKARYSKKRQQIMCDCLLQHKSNQVLVLCQIINLFKKYFKVLFAKMKG